MTILLKYGKSKKFKSFMFIKYIVYSLFLFFPLKLIGQNNLTKKQIIEKIRTQYTTFTTCQSVGIENTIYKKNGENFNESNVKFNIWATNEKVLFLCFKKYKFDVFTDTTKEDMVLFGEKGKVRILKLGGKGKLEDMIPKPTFDKTLVNRIEKYEPMFSLMFKTTSLQNYFFRDTALDSLHLVDTIYQGEPCYKFNLKYSFEKPTPTELTDDEKKSLDVLLKEKPTNSLPKPFVYEQYLLLRQKRAGTRYFDIAYYFRKKDFLLFYYTSDMNTYTDGYERVFNKTITISPQFNQPLDEKIFEKYRK